MRCRQLVLALMLDVLLVLLAAGLAGAQATARPDPGSFRVEWNLRTGFWRPAVEGYVYNQSEYRVGNVRLRVDVLDASGRRVGGQTAWVHGAIDSGGRAYFAIPPPAQGQTYEIAVEGFDLLARQPRLDDFEAP